MAEASHQFQAAIEAGAVGEMLATSYYNRGVLLRNVGALDDALQSYMGAVEVDPTVTRVPSPTAIDLLTWIT